MPPTKHPWIRAAAVFAGLTLAGCREETSPQAINQPTNPITAVTATSHSSQWTNLLAGEKSPYLLQHQHNPVDWHPWGEEAFAKARAEQKPIFLSIGYSTCHWCHVMERETFEDETVAAFLNAHFVSIKVDREERPDVDKIYMTFVQVSSGSGGWPLNVFLTPDLKPFYGGTYWPPTSRYGRPSFFQVIENVQQAWAGRRDQIVGSAEDVHSRLQELTHRDPAESSRLSTNVVRDAARAMKSNYDAVHGGFGNAPKFPTPSYTSFMLHYGARYGDDEAVQMVLHTCDRMAAGGIYDQLGGGFSRYAVDAKWLVPHFEKMLYDNAQLAQLYLDAYLVSGQDRYAAVVRDILRYVLRDMSHPEGGFYSAEDADSEGHEGKYYAWTKDELARLLSAEEFDAAVRYFGVTEKGNFEDHSHPEPLPNQNVLSVVDTNLSAAQMTLVRAAKGKMFAARSKRVRPHMDDKVLATWNGLMLGAVARAASVLGDDAYLEAALRNAVFLKTHLWDEKTKTLYHRWRDGERDEVQLQEAYAFLMNGVLDLYEATLDPAHLEWAVAMAESMLGRFYDAEAGGFWQSANHAPDLIIRIKEDYDGAEPSGNSAAVMGLWRLAFVTGRAEFREAAEKTLKLLGDRLERAPQAVPYLLLGLDYTLEEPRRFVLAGDATSPEGRALLRAAHNTYPRHRVLLGTRGPVEPFGASLPAKDGKPTAYLCTGNACLPPTHDPAKVRELFRGRMPEAGRSVSGR